MNLEFSLAANLLKRRDFYEPNCIIAMKLFLRRTLQGFVHSSAEQRHQIVLMLGFLLYFIGTVKQYLMLKIKICCNFHLHRGY
ncbi:MAG: hypothetical protein ABIO05_00010 [Ferruginibacter sp.]